MAKKGQKKMKVTLSKSKNSESLGRAVGDIDKRTKTGASGMNYTGYWNGRNYSEAEFYANPKEVKKIQKEVEFENGVTIHFKK